MNVMMMPDYRMDNPYQTLLANALQAEGVAVYFPQGYRRVLPIWRAVRQQPVAIAVLHLHWVNPYLKGSDWLTRLVYSIKFLLDVLMVRLSGVRVVWTVHNRIAHETHFPRLERWTQQMLAHLVDRLIVHHQSALNELVQSYRLDQFRVEVIPHGHYREAYGAAINALEARRLLNLPLTGRLYLHLGMLRPYKGIEHLLQVWQEQKSILEGNTLVIAGKPLDAGYGEKLERLAALAGAILHSGFIEGDRIPLYFSAADVVVLPFKAILTSGSLILAMSYGKPVIAPRTDTIVETLGAADWLLYDPQDEQGLLYALKDSTQVDLDGLSRLMMQECDRLDWRYIAKETQQTYRARFKRYFR
ncbi:glycosyltransferase [Leptothermofonsia sichuanensis E412]|uniref:glycosyltransferase n=1 Tax=Leptothermofonsia sichuanensis TaxID=2917832 RepID=UPI001CA6A925|nr:glycosyltransferase [Leptothermofonsia sichuanensis]QZZ20416.1 glycosyltransferase [Leptothermofonsia sichuanensis E412]